MKRVKVSIIAMVMGWLTLPVAAETTCYGEDAYRVCTTVTQRADGSISVRSSDTMGNSYSIDTDVYRGPNGDMTVTSRDSEGNRYRVDSWNDRISVHSRDSEGNHCTVTRTGKLIGC